MKIVTLYELENVFVKCAVDVKVAQIGKDEERTEDPVKSFAWFVIIATRDDQSLQIDTSSQDLIDAFNILGGCVIPPV